MPKLKTDAVGVADLNEYLSTAASDFSFEMQVLKKLRDLGLTCEHGGLYEDPVTKKPREFDIRAFHRTGACYIRLAIECKNLSDHFPLLVSSVPRVQAEAFHDFLVLAEPRTTGDPRAQRLRALGSDLYPARGLVVKSTAQVGRVDSKEAPISASDSEVYEKWGQALASAHDLVLAAARDASEDHSGQPSFAAVVPVLVVPNDRLWEVSFDENGKQRGC